MTPKSSVLLADTVLAVALTGLFVLAQPSELAIQVEAFVEVSPRAAESLRGKIVDIIVADETPTRPSDAVVTIEASEIELESFVLFAMKDDIPAQVDQVDVEIEPGLVSAQTQLTFVAEGVGGNPILDFLIGGTHTFFIQGRLEAEGGRGKFDLRSVRVDGFPVPTLIIEALVGRYVTPKYPKVDLSKPFEVPWGIEEIVLTPNIATIIY
jgi:hypothetical protein